MPTRAGADFVSTLSAYLDALAGLGRSGSLMERARLVLPRLFAFLHAQGVRDLRSVGEAHLVAFAAHLAQAPKKRGAGVLSPGARAVYLAAVRSFFAFLDRRGFLLRNPAHDLPLPKLDRLPRRVLTEAEARRLVEAPSRWGATGQRDRALLELLYGTGLRRGECVRLDLGDVDLGEGLVFVRDGKGKQDRLVPLGGRALAALDLYLRESRPELMRVGVEPALLLSKYGRRLSPAHTNVIVKQHANAAGVRGPVFPHALRHTYATHLLRGGASIRHVQALLGHRSLQATALYTRVGVEDLRQVLARCHPRERRRRRRR